MKFPSLRLRSFRLRVALQAALLTLLSLAIFTAMTWHILLQQRLQQIDGALYAEFAGELSRRLPRQVWPTIYQQLDGAFSGYTPANTDSQRVLLLALDQNREVAFRSETWPVHLQPEQLPPVASIHVRQPSSRPASPPPPAAGAERPQPADRPPPYDEERNFVPHGQMQQQQLDRIPAPPYYKDLKVDMRTVEVDGVRWRMGGIEHPAWKVYAGVNLDLVRTQLLISLSQLWIVVPPALLLMLLGAWVVAGRALRSVSHLSDNIASIDVADLTQRLSDADNDREFAAIVAVFNALLERLERSFHQAKRFSGDAAHELKTPMMILHAGLEQALQQAPDGSALQSTLSKLLEETHRLHAIIGKLLLLAQADAGRLPLQRGPIDLYAMLEELEEDYSMAAPERDFDWQVPRPLVISGDPDLLRQVFHNLISNAIKYGRPEGWIRLVAHRQGDLWCLDLANASVGIAIEFRDHLFDRFYRIPTTVTQPERRHGGTPDMPRAQQIARQGGERRVDGLGLGLGLAREIARAHGGDLVLLHAEPGEACFRLTLPALPAPEGTENRQKTVPFHDKTVIGSHAETHLV
ncbi:ATP-binding protein [Pokkaliibacter sp. MBI-7]|uniref:sensor histidine kinase n=1 Tax=Pokkaliibacter sp. MBI-7 TaxID=3040600 RepID=UPI00244ACFD7|nr:ATP-binding protein [Pokkaliibacter sp. MBI-7]MDH2432630.1 ATP-binding protein [Pokkaliibacter sp. MBI-7]